METHRRSLWQVLALYMVASWMVYEVILGLTEGMVLPLWVPGFAVVLFLIGLPVVLATAFVQDTAAAPDPPQHPDAVPAAPPLDEGTPPAGRSRRLSWGRLVLAGGLMAALFLLVTTGFMGMRLLGIGPAATLVARGELEAREPLVVADFEGLTGDTSLAMVVAEGLRADLAQSEFVTAADRSRIRETLDLMLRPPGSRLDPATAREVAVRMGLKAVVEGEVGRAGAGYMLTARIVTADSARTLAAFRETAADSTAVLAAIERLSRALRARVGESLRTVRASPPLARVTTASLPALRKAAEATMEEARLDRPRAIRLLQQAVTLDPAFSAAWASLAVLHYNRGDRRATLDAIRRAMEHEDRLTEQQRHQARGLYAVMTGDHRAAEIEQREVAALDPADPRPQVLLSDIAWNRGDWAAAESHARRGLELGSESWVAHWNLVVALLDGGRVTEAREAVDRAADALPADNDIPRQLMTMVLAAQARYDAVHDSSAHNPFRAALADRVLGRWAEAERHSLDRGDTLNARLWLAMDRALVLDDPAAALTLEAILDSLIVGQHEPPERHFAELGVALAVAGRPDAARRARAVYLERVPEEMRWSDAFLLHALDGFLALRQGDGDGAIASLRRARESTPWTAPVDAFLGRAWESVQRPDSAIAAYRRSLDSPWSDRIGFFHLICDAALLAPTHERLAYLYEEAGEAALAARHAGAVASLWRRADPDLRDRVRAMLRILDRATAERGQR